LCLCGELFHFPMSLAYIPLFRITEHAGARITLHRVYHYLKREPDEMYFGLGERAGVTNRAGQSYRLTNLDAMGYNARTTDPLYKHIPYYLTWKSPGL
jgi:alpha-glucosidase (family GH31 glycosyl hydrolase)